MRSFKKYAHRARGGAGTSTVLVVAGTRPESIKLAPVVWTLAADRGLQTITVNSGQHAQAVRATFGEFNISSDVELAAMPALPNLLAAFEHLQTELHAVIDRYRPRCVLVQGDTLTSYTAAFVGRACRSLVAHVEAGLRTATPTDPFPEEWFRRRIARLADIHFAPTSVAEAHLHAEGVAPGAVHRTGNTGIDSLAWMLDQLDRDPAAKAPSLRNAVLITLHRRENYDRNADMVCRALLRLAARHPHLEMVFPVHPNPRVAEPIRRRLGGHPSFQLIEPMTYRDFIATARHAALIISDSGGVQEEAPHLGTPLLVPRCNTERPEAIDTGFVRLVSVDEHAIVTAAEAALAASRRPPLPIDDAAPFGAGDAAARIVRVLKVLTVERAIA